MCYGSKLMSLPGAQYRHLSVLPVECLEGLAVEPGKTYIDGTLGAAGHSKMILEALKGQGHLFSFDQDSEVITRIEKEAQDYDNWTLVHDNFSQLKELCQEKNLKIDGGILLDLGFSSIQMDDHRRGFSFDSDSPLDMRLDPSLELSAEDIVNRYQEKALADIIYEYGEERKSRQIAALIVKNRPFKSCRELADQIKSYAARGANGKTFRIHPATKTFQALRIFVNSELLVLKKILADLQEIGMPGTRVAIISFHSLEDRIVKNHFREMAKEDKLKIITKKPLVACDEELDLNPRSRSAKLRIAELA